MFIDARTVERESVIDVPLAVIGAGPTGLAAAAQFFGSPIPVIILESGGLTFEAAAQALAKGENAGARFLAPHISRYRGFGGTSKRWAGFCRPLDVDDYVARPWIPFSEWPFGADEITPYLQDALEFSGIHEMPDWNAESDHEEMGAIARRLANSGPLLPYALYRTPDRHFGDALREQFRRAGNVTTFMHAHVAQIETDQSASRIERLRIHCHNGNAFTVRPDHVILAAGGIENARLLLLSNAKEPCGIGNRHDLVGRFLMNHPYLMGTWIELSTGRQRLGTASKRYNPRSYRLLLNPEVTAQERMARFSAYLLPATAERLHPWARSRGLDSLTTLLGINTEAEHDPDRLLHLARVAGDLPGLTRDAVRKLSARYLGYRYICFAAETEQVPNPDSRVTLSHNRDALGQNQVRIEWRLDPIDKHTIKRGLEILAEAASRSGLGRATHHEWLETDGLDNYPGGDWAHHAGTTRMSDNPKSGVVDRNGRVHGLANLHITGCSVFPTEGVAPPTLMAIALSIRLARHLKTTALSGSVVTLPTRRRDQHPSAALR